MRKCGKPIIDWLTIWPGKEWRGEWRGFRLSVVTQTNVGTMYAGFINGGQVLRARSSRMAKERLGDEVSKLWRRQQERERHEALAAYDAEAK